MPLGAGVKNRALLSAGDSFFFDQSEYAALPVWLVTMWLFAFTRTQATNYDFFGGIVYVT